MTKEKRDKLLRERSNLLSNIRSIARVERFLTAEQIKPYERMAERIVEIDKLLKEAKDEQTSD